MQQFIESHFASLLRASWQAAVLILLVLAAQRAFGRRLSPRWRYSLWLLVVIRLVLPWTIPSPVSLFNLLNFPAGSPLSSGAAATPGETGTEAAQSNSVVLTEPPGRASAFKPAAAASFGASLSGLLWLWSAGASALTI